MVLQARKRHERAEGAYRLLASECFVYGNLPVDLNMLVFEAVEPGMRSMLALVCHEFGSIISYGRGIIRPNCIAKERPRLDLSQCRVLWKSDRESFQAAVKEGAGRHIQGRPSVDEDSRASFPDEDSRGSLPDMGSSGVSTVPLPSLTLQPQGGHWWLQDIGPETINMLEYGTY